MSETRRILLVGGTVVDGTGAAPLSADLLIGGSRILEVGRFAPPPDAAVFDCAGLTVAPGFIDAHSHSDLQVLENRREKVLQGVTTEVVGNCGFSPYPALDDRTSLHDFANGILCGSGNWGWASAREYLDATLRAHASVLSLAGHGALRIAVAGTRLGPLEEDGMRAMERLLAEALEQGACGFSTGLMYSPGASVPPEELERLCRLVARHGKIHATHIRNYSERLEEAIDEQLELARRTGCRLEISHLQAVGPANWPRQERALAKIERARADGIDVAFDCYPYTYGSTVLTQLLPQWSLEGGTPALLGRLAGAALRARIALETEAGLAQGWDGIFVAGVRSATSQALVGRSIAEIAHTSGAPPVEAALDLLVREQGAVNILERNQSDANLRQAIVHDLSMIVSDGFYVTGRPHPRLHGTFPHLLGGICRERGWLPLADAVRKVTGEPARRFGIRNRGRLAAGYFADIAVFDANAIASPATYEHPDVPPVGIRWVFREGGLVVENPL